MENNYTVNFGHRIAENLTKSFMKIISEQTSRFITCLLLFLVYWLMLELIKAFILHNLWEKIKAATKIFPATVPASNVPVKKYFYEIRSKNLSQL